jgi:hypothetical protein
MKARLTFGMSMGITFDTYLVDEITATGDAAFRAKSHAIFRDRIGRAGALIVSHNMDELRTLCDAALCSRRARPVLRQVEDGIAAHRAQMDPSHGADVLPCLAADRCPRPAGIDSPCSDRHGSSRIRPIHRRGETAASERANRKHAECPN